MNLFSRKTDQIEVTISNRTIVRTLLLVIAAFILLAAVRKASHALTLIFIAFFLALALNAPVHWVAHHLPGKRRGDRTVATAISFLVVVLVLGAFLASIVPPLVKQVGSFIDAIPGLINDLHDESTTLGRYVERYNLENQVSNLSDQVSEWTSGITGDAVNVVGRVGSSIASTLTVLVLTFMMLIEGPRWIRIGRRLTPDEKEAHIESLARSMYRVIKGYVNGQVILALAAAVMLLPVLVLMDVSYPFALAVMVFICGLIPMIGHTIGAVLVSLVALFTSPVAALVVFVYYILYQQIENYAVQPKVQANSTDMSPLLVFSSVVIGISFNGLLGGLVAIPVMGCIRILLLDYLYRHNLIKQSAATGLEVVDEKDLPKA